MQNKSIKKNIFKRISYNEFNKSLNDFIKENEKDYQKTDIENLFVVIKRIDINDNDLKEDNEYNKKA